jgi:hypothetical protein
VNSIVQRVLSEAASFEVHFTAFCGVENGFTVLGAETGRNPDIFAFKKAMAVSAQAVRSKAQACGLQVFENASCDPYLPLVSNFRTY